MPLSNIYSPVYSFLEAASLESSTSIAQEFNPVRLPSQDVGTRIDYVGATSSMRPKKYKNDIDSLTDINDVAKKILDFVTATKGKPQRCSFRITINKESESPARTVNSKKKPAATVEAYTEGQSPGAVIKTRVENIVTCMNVADNLRYVAVVLRSPTRDNEPKTNSNMTLMITHIFKFPSNKKAKNFVGWISDEITTLAVKKGKIEDYDTEDFLDLYEPTTVIKHSENRKCRKPQGRTTSLTEINGKEMVLEIQPSRACKKASSRRMRRGSSSTELLQNFIVEKKASKKFLNTETTNVRLLL